MMDSEAAPQGQARQRDSPQPRPPDLSRRNGECLGDGAGGDDLSGPEPIAFRMQSQDLDQMMERKGRGPTGALSLVVFRQY